MLFDLHPCKYHVRICPGPLTCEGEPVLAVVHGREILLAGTLKPEDRLQPLLEQLQWLRERHHGKLGADGVAGFTADMARQLHRQGGEAALLRLGSDGMVDAGAAPDLGAEPTGCECGRCGTKYAPHQIRTSGPEFHAGIGRSVVQRSVDCDFCNHVMSWVEAATNSGAPNGRVVSGPFYSGSHVTAG